MRVATDHVEWRLTQNPPQATTSSRPESNSQDITRYVNVFLALFLFYFFVCFLFPFFPFSLFPFFVLFLVSPANLVSFSFCFVFGEPSYVT